MPQHSVLVVEDDPEINALVGAYAQLCGFTYRRALTGAMAMREIQQNPPSLVVLDIMLPDINGFDICSRIKAEKETRAMPVIMLTALSDDASRQRGKQCGADEYLTKPFDPEQLMKAMRGVMSDE